MQISITYDSITARATRKGKCPGCGKPVKRARTFTMTNSPFTKVTNADGTKRRPFHDGEIQTEVDNRAAAWAPDPEYFRHGTC